MNTLENCSSLFAGALNVLQCQNPETKCELAASLHQSWLKGQLSLTDTNASPADITQPGRPEKPVLVHPSKLAKRSLYTARGRQILMHAIAHIEFNAINLACDAVYRFRGLPEAYYSDWVSVAADEARHFRLVSQYLKIYDVDYGDYPAHSGLWDMAIKTSDDVLHRLAMVPRVMEARGLDVTPGMIQVLESVGDYRAASVLKTIYEEEISHVAAGSRWFKYICKQRGLEPVGYFCSLIGEHLKKGARGQLNFQARRKAGFTEEELKVLNS